MDRLEYHLVVTYEQISTSRVFVYGIINHILLQVMIACRLICVFYTAFQKHMQKTASRGNKTLSWRGRKMHFYKNEIFLQKSTFITLIELSNV